MFNSVVLIILTITGVALFLGRLIGIFIYDFNQAKLNKKILIHPQSKALRARPFVSVIILAQGSDKELEKCLLSIAKNTYRKYEILIISQSSYRDLNHTVNQFQKRYRSKQIKLTTQRGRSICDISKRTKGEYVLVVNSKYELEKDAISQSVKYFAIRPSTGAPLVASLRNSFDYTLTSLVRQYLDVLKQQELKVRSEFFGINIDREDFYFSKRELISQSTKAKYNTNAKLITKYTKDVSVWNAQIAIMLTAVSIISYFVYLAFMLGTVYPIALVWLGVSIYLAINVWLVDYINIFTKLNMILLAPAVSILFYFLNVARILKLAFIQPIREQASMKLIHEFTGSPKHASS